jgi:hypothetical protein
LAPSPCPYSSSCTSSNLATTSLACLGDDDCRPLRVLPRSLRRHPRASPLALASSSSTSSSVTGNPYVFLVSSLRLSTIKRIHVHGAITHITFTTTFHADERAYVYSSIHLIAHCVRRCWKSSLDSRHLSSAPPPKRQLTKSKRATFNWSPSA